MSANPTQRDPYVARALAILIHSRFTRDNTWSEDDPVVVRLSTLLEVRDETLGPVTGNERVDVVTAWVYVEGKADPIVLKDVDREAAELAQTDLFINSLLDLGPSPTLLRSYDTEQTMANVSVLTGVTSIVLTPQPKLEAVTGNAAQRIQASLKGRH